MSLHATSDNCWLLIHDRIYDVTNFLDLHPGLSAPLLQFAGDDASEVFAEVSHSTTAHLIMEEMEVVALRLEREGFPRGLAPPKNNASSRRNWANLVYDAGMYGVSSAQHVYSENAAIDAAQVAAEAAQAAAEAAAEAAQVAAEAAQSVRQAAQAAAEAAQNLRHSARAAAEAAHNRVQAAAEAAQSTVQVASEVAQNTVQAASEVVHNKVHAASEAAHSTVQAASDAAHSLAHSLSGSLTSLPSLSSLSSYMDTTTGASWAGMEEASKLIRRKWSARRRQRSMPSGG